MHSMEDKRQYVLLILMLHTALPTLRTWQMVVQIMLVHALSGIREGSTVATDVHGVCASCITIRYDQPVPVMPRCVRPFLKAGQQL